MKPLYTIHTVSRNLLADTYTPVGVYARLREQFPLTFLLESSDYHSHENSHSFICAEPISSIFATSDTLDFLVKGEKVKSFPLENKIKVPEEIDAFLAAFRPADNDNEIPYNGFYGYTCYDAVQFFDNISFREKPGNDIPLIQYHLFRYVLMFDHFREQLYLYENGINEKSDNLSFIESLIKNKNFRSYPFAAGGEAESNMSDAAFMENVEKGKQHCQRGDVFQVVMSRGFSQPFTGDDFNVYRTLRSINPSPYLFYFDFGSFRIFGSSPEAQLVIKKGRAFINPIAGTFKRTGNDEHDREKAQELLKDAKENAEHVMLVDLARNDLSVHCKNVIVEKFKDVHFYSHVIHLVSTVSGEILEAGKPFQLFSKTFPAGTLSGAPKYRAMQLIDECEPTARSFYGGAIGIIGSNGSMNQAIIIRSFLSKDNLLRSQAGAGVVINSVPESELQEVNNKLGALKKAVEEAGRI